MPTLELVENKLPPPDFNNIEEYALLGRANRSENNFIIFKTTHKFGTFLTNKNSLISNKLKTISAIIRNHH